MPVGLVTGDNFISEDVCFRCICNSSATVPLERSSQFTGRGRNYRPLRKRWRCLVPASGFYEWKTVAGKKHPYSIRAAGDELFGFAGITELWTARAGPVHSVSLITTAPNEVMRDIHDKMPVIVPVVDYRAWLNPTNANAAELKQSNRAYPSELILAHPVSIRVNTPRNDDAELIAPISA